ncbi:alpha-ketoglutarate-dependent taurine dioxygenase [Rhodoblastus acidophilus]|nr:TauD/TfdA family dioxygenase [Rhodoblastus acidophilus]MCW2272851.1 alpha-ketoglutarate-dependent taurine dioxygenase [Rhodoblastus acidophilus]
MKLFEQARQSAEVKWDFRTPPLRRAFWRPEFLTDPAGADWRVWRAAKLDAAARFLQCAPVRVADPRHVSAAEKVAVRAQIALANAALYEWEAPPSQAEDLDRALLEFSTAFGLNAFEDHRSANRNGVVRIEVNSARGFYIPYTDKPIAWHTDGYYNYHGPAKNVQAMILHCAEAADEGGENRLLDPELAFLRLAEFDVSALRLLLHPEAMIIPEARDEAGRVRAENRGPVFFLSNAGALSMRYTARKKNIVWRDDATRAAAAALLAVIESEPLVRREKLRPGQGVLCNNILHDRAAFANGAAPRLLCRVRFHTRIDSEF